MKQNSFHINYFKLLKSNQGTMESIIPYLEEKLLIFGY